MYPLEYSIIEIGMVIYKSVCEVHSVNINTLMQGLHMYKLQARALYIHWKTFTLIPSHFVFVLSIQLLE